MPSKDLKQTEHLLGLMFVSWCSWIKLYLYVLCLLPSNTTFLSLFYYYLALIVQWSHFLFFFFLYQDERFKGTNGYSPIGKKLR